MNQDEFRQSMRMAISSSLGVNLPEIRILFYTDDPQKVHENPHDPRGFGVFQLEEHLRVHSPAFAKVTEWKWPLPNIPASHEKMTLAGRQRRRGRNR